MSSLLVFNRVYRLGIQNLGGGEPQTPATKTLYWSIFEKSRHLGFGVFICRYLVHGVHLYFSSTFYFHHKRVKAGRENALKNEHFLHVLRMFPQTKGSICNFFELNGLYVRSDPVL